MAQRPISLVTLEGRGLESSRILSLSPFLSLSLPTAAAAANDEEDENRRSARQFVTDGAGAATVLRPFVTGLGRVSGMEQPCETNDGR